MVTIHDIAKKAGVSSMTVSRVINKSPKISEATRQKVEKIIHEMNYIPNSAARSLIVKETKILSILITDITNPFFTKVVRGAEDSARERGYRLLLSNSDEDFTKESEYLNIFLSTPVDGVLFAASSDQSKENIEFLAKRNIPVVLIDREVPGVKADLVTGDNRKGTFQLIEHLIQLGHKKIALISGPENVSTAKMRQLSYLECLEQNNLPIIPELIIETTYKQNSAIEAVKQLLSLPKQKLPTAIFAANNFLALDTLQVLQSKGLKVPADISIACFDDFEPILPLNPFLTVAAQPAYDFGYLGTKLLIDRIEKKSSEKYHKVVLEPKLIVRDSTGPCL